MPDDVVLRFSEQGAKQVKKPIDDLTASGERLAKAWKSAAEAAAPLKNQADQMSTAAVQAAAVQQRAQETIARSAIGGAQAAGNFNQQMRVGSRLVVGLGADLAGQLSPSLGKTAQSLMAGVAAGFAFGGAIGVAVAVTQALITAVSEWIEKSKQAEEAQIRLTNAMRTRDLGFVIGEMEKLNIEMQKAGGNTDENRIKMEQLRQTAQFIYATVDAKKLERDVDRDRLMLGKSQAELNMGQAATIGTLTDALERQLLITKQLGDVQAASIIAQAEQEARKLDVLPGMEKQAQDIRDAGIARAKIAQEAARNERETLTQAAAEKALAIKQVEQQYQSDALRGEREFLAQRIQVQTGSAAASAVVQRETLDQLITMEKRKHDERLATLSQYGALNADTMAKAEQELQGKLLPLQQQRQMQELKVQEALLADVSRLQDDQTRIVMAASEMRIAAIENETQRSLASLELANTSSRELITTRAQIEESSAERIKSSRLDAIRAEEDTLRQRAAMFANNADVQRSVEQRIMELQQQRYQAEVTADGQILAARKQMVDGLKAEADREAGIGESITGKAIAALRKRGKTKIDASDIAEETGRMRERGAEAFGALQTGGRVKIGQLEEAMSNRQLFADMASMGTTTQGALGQFAGRGAASFAGRRFTPRTVGGMEIPEFNMPGAPTAPTMSPGESLDQMSARIKEAGDKVITEIQTRIPGVMSEFFQKFNDELIRTLEKEAARI